MFRFKTTWRAIRKAVKSASKIALDVGPDRPILRHVMFDLDAGGELRAIAADGYRMLVIHVLYPPVDDFPGPGSWLVPAPALLPLNGLDGLDDVTLRFEDTTFTIEAEDLNVTTAIARPPESFPVWRELAEQFREKPCATSRYGALKGDDLNAALKPHRKQWCVFLHAAHEWLSMTSWQKPETEAWNVHRTLTPAAFKDQTGYAAINPRLWPRKLLEHAEFLKLSLPEKSTCPVKIQAPGIWDFYLMPMHVEELPLWLKREAGITDGSMPGEEWRP